MPAVSDTLRFFAGAGRVPEGQASGEYAAGRTSIIRREPAGVVGQIAPWNYPLMMAAWKIGPALAAGCTIVLKPAETTPITTVKLAELRRRGAAEGRAQRDHRPRPAGGLVARHAPGHRHGLADRLARDRQVDREGRGRLAQARAPRARRQGAGDRVRRRGHGDRARDDRRHGALQRRPGLHRGHARARLVEGLRRRGERARRAGEGLQGRRHVRPGDHARAGELDAPARARRGLPRAQARQRGDRDRRQASPTCPARSSSRRSSPASSRTTR